MIDRYRIISSASCLLLMDAANEYLVKGWKMLGAPFVVNGVWYQAIVRSSND